MEWLVRETHNFYVAVGRVLELEVGFSLNQLA